jgi:heme-degrading monooxygenase HmoA
MPRYLVIGKVTLAPGSRPMAEQVADQGGQGFAQFPGFEEAIFFLDEERNEYGAISIWESREAAERSGRSGKGRSRRASTRSTSISAKRRVRGWRVQAMAGGSQALATGFVSHSYAPRRSTFRGRPLLLRASPAILLSVLHP